MTPYDAKSHFSKLVKNQYFSRVDSEHPLELYLGVDKEGRKALRFFGTFAPSKVTSTKAIAVKHFSSDGRNCIQFSLVDSEVSDPFYKFIDDLVDSSRRLKNSLDAERYRFVILRYTRWKKMFVPAREILPESQIIGLLGELYFLLSVLLPKYGEEKAICSWSASEPTLKDFSIDGTWYEIKTAGSKAQTVHINSIQQLEFDHPGKLIVIRLEKMAGTFSGLTLNSLVQSLLSKIISPELVDDFQTKLAKRGYAINKNYDDFVYEIKEMKAYLVDKAFPKIKIETMDDAIVNAEYDLSIEKLKNYIVDLD